MGYPHFKKPPQLPELFGVSVQAIPGLKTLKMLEASRLQHADSCPPFLWQSKVISFVLFERLQKRWFSKKKKRSAEHLSAFLHSTFLTGWNPSWLQFTSGVPSCNQLQQPGHVASRSSALQRSLNRDGSSGSTCITTHGNRIISRSFKMIRIHMIYIIYNMILYYYI